MGMVVRLRHATASSRGGRKSSAVTAPSVAELIAAAKSLESQLSSSQSCVTRPGDTPTKRANSIRLMPLDSKYAASFMEPDFSLTETSAQVKFQAGAMDPTGISVPYFNMAKTKAKVQPRFKESARRPTFIRQWRKDRGLTQERLAARIGMSTGNLSNIETGKQPYGQDQLEAIAEALGCDVVDLLIRDPGNPEGIWSLWDKAKPGEREQIVAHARVIMRRTAAGG